MKWMYSMFLMMSAQLSVAHPLHVSICEMNYNKDDQSLEIVLKMFIDEMESAVLLEHGKRLNLGAVNQSRDTDSLVQLYLFKHFSVNVDDRKTKMTYLGSETENLDRIVTYMIIRDIKSIESLSVFNEVFQELFDDQINMLHMDIDGKKKSTFFSNKKREEAMKF